LTSDVDSELPHRPHWRSVFSSVFKELIAPACVFRQ
jgi:hypothetical protein